MWHGLAASLGWSGLGAPGPQVLRTCVKAAVAERASASQRECQDIMAATQAAPDMWPAANSDAAGLGAGPPGAAASAAEADHGSPAAGPAGCAGAEPGSNAPAERALSAADMEDWGSEGACEGLRRGALSWRQAQSDVWDGGGGAETRGGPAEAAAVTPAPSAWRRMPGRRLDLDGVQDSPQPGVQDSPQPGVQVSPQPGGLGAPAGPGGAPAWMSPAEAMAEGADEDEGDDMQADSDGGARSGHIPQVDGAGDSDSGGEAGDGAPPGAVRSSPGAAAGGGPERRAGDACAHTSPALQHIPDAQPAIAGGCVAGPAPAAWACAHAGQLTRPDAALLAAHAAHLSAAARGALAAPTSSSSGGRPLPGGLASGSPPGVAAAPAPGGLPGPCSGSPRAAAAQPLPAPDADLGGGGVHAARARADAERRAVQRRVQHAAALSAAARACLAPTSPGCRGDASLPVHGLQAAQGRTGEGVAAIGSQETGRARAPGTLAALDAVPDKNAGGLAEAPGAGVVCGDVAGASAGALGAERGGGLRPGSAGGRAGTPASAVSPAGPRAGLLEPHSALQGMPAKPMLSQGAEAGGGAAAEAGARASSTAAGAIRAPAAAAPRQPSSDVAATEQDAAGSQAASVGGLPVVVEAQRRSSDAVTRGSGARGPAASHPAAGSAAAAAPDASRAPASSTVAPTEPDRATPSGGEAPSVPMPARAAQAGARRAGDAGPAAAGRDPASQGRAADADGHADAPGPASDGRGGWESDSGSGFGSGSPGRGRRGRQAAGAPARPRLVAYRFRTLAPTQARGLSSHVLSLSRQWRPAGDLHATHTEGTAALQ